jgi:putative tricarboxylic transport membrane protein
MPLNHRFALVRRAALCALAAVAACAGAAEESWKPQKRVVEFVVPNAPGGGNDRTARLIVKLVQEHRLVEPTVTVVNKPGAGVVMGMTYLNQHPADGHSIGIVAATMTGDYVAGRSAISPDDITPIAQLFTEYVAFAARPDSAIKDGKDLLARFKADTGSVSTSISGGIGNHNHIALALVARAAGGVVKRLKVVTFNSGGESITAALGGHVDMVVSPAGTVLPHVQGGRLRFIALTAPKRLGGAYADVPVWTELGANVDVSNWRTIVGPRGMTAPQVAYWEGVLTRVTQTDEWKQMIEKIRADPEFLGSARARAQIRTEVEELRAVMSELGLK